MSSKGGKEKNGKDQKREAEQMRDGDKETEWKRREG
jgi:hypothetical protein